MSIGFYKTPEQLAESSGKINERFVFGGVRVHDPLYEEEKRRVIQKYREKGKQAPLREALEVIKRFQPFKPDSREPVDPASPIKQFPHALRRKVAEKLGFRDLQEKKVLFWTAIDSFVDTGYGADAILEVEEPDGLSRLIRLGVTLETPEQYRKDSAADKDRVIIYGKIPDVHEAKKKYDELVERTAEETVKKLKMQGNPLPKVLRSAMH